MLNINDAIIGTIENTFRIGNVDKQNHTCKYEFDYVENGNHHNCMVSEYKNSDNNHTRNISMGNIGFSWSNNSWKLLVQNPDKEYFKIFVGMLICIERELEIKLPDGLLG